MLKYALIYISLSLRFNHFLIAPFALTIDFSLINARPSIVNMFYFHLLLHVLTCSVFAL